MPVDPTPNLAAFSAGDVPTAAQFDTWHDALDSQTNTWTNYTPSLTNVTVGAGGVLVGRYNQSGKRVDFLIALTWGSGTSWTSPRFGLPVAPQNSNWVAPAFLFRASLNTSRQPGICSVNGSTMVPYSGSGDVVATVPFTWTTGDIIRITGTYEAA